MSGGPSPDDPYLENLQSACREARHTVDQQIEKIHREDEKAVKLLRVNTLTLGVLASGLSITIQADSIPAEEFLNAHMVVGLLAMIFASIIAAMAYTSSSFESGINPNAVRNSPGMDRRRFLEKLSFEYSQWIQSNSTVHRFNAHAITWAIAFAISGIMFFIGGFSIGLLQMRVSWQSGLLFLIETVIVLVTIQLLFVSDDLLRVVMTDE